MKLLTKILGQHDVDISAVLLKDGSKLWETITHKVYPKRHRIVHLAEPATEADAVLAIECAERLRSDVVLPIAKKMGFTLDVTGVWHRTETQGSSSHFRVCDPFTRG